MVVMKHLLYFPYNKNLLVRSGSTDSYIFAYFKLIIEANFVLRRFLISLDRFYSC